MRGRIEGAICAALIVGPLVAVFLLMWREI